MVRPRRHPTGRLFRRILVPHDLSAPAARALAVAAGVARATGGRLVVLHAIVPASGLAEYPGVEERVDAAAGDVIAAVRRHLAALVARTLGRRRPPAVECRVVLGDPFQCIMEAARDADSIVLATHGRSGLPHLLIGSVAEKVVRHAPVPVLTVR